MKRRCLLLNIGEPGVTVEALGVTEEKAGGMGGQEGEQQEESSQSSEGKQQEEEDISVVD